MMAAGAAARSAGAAGMSIGAERSATAVVVSQEEEGVADGYPPARLPGPVAALSNMAARAPWPLKDPSGPPGTASKDDR